MLTSLLPILDDSSSLPLARSAPLWCRGSAGRGTLAQRVLYFWQGLVIPTCQNTPSGGITIETSTRKKSTKPPFALRAGSCGVAARPVHEGNLRSRC